MLFQLFFFFLCFIYFLFFYGERAVVALSLFYWRSFVGILYIFQVFHPFSFHFFMSSCPSGVLLLSDYSFVPIFNCSILYFITFPLFFYPFYTHFFAAAFLSPSLQAFFFFFYHSPFLLFPRSLLPSVYFPLPFSFPPSAFSSFPSPIVPRLSLFLSLTLRCVFISYPTFFSDPLVYRLLLLFLALPSSFSLILVVHYFSFFLRPCLCHTSFPFLALFSFLPSHLPHVPYFSLPPPPSSPNPFLASPPVALFPLSLSRLSSRTYEP